MRRWVFALWVVFAVGFFSRADAAFFDGVKVAPGVFWNNSILLGFNPSGAGLHLSADFRPLTPFIFTPFYEVFAGGDTTQLLGMELNWSVSMRDYETHFLFFGGNIGKAFSKGQKAETVYGGQLGYKFPLNDRLGLFVQVKYIQSHDQVFSGVSGHIGATFRAF